MKISVIIPNKAGRKIDTDLSDQTFTDYELIIIKDKYLRGQSWALNQGIKKAKGEYLMFLDDDLVLEEDMLEVLYNAIDGTSHSIAYGNYRLGGMLSGVHRAQEWNQDELRKYNYISGCSMVRAKGFPGWDENIYRLKDWDVWLTMAEQGKTGIWVDKILFMAFFYEDGISSYNDGGKAEAIIKKKHNL